MAKIRKKSGDIFEISLLPHHDLYAYAKYFDVNKFNPKVLYPDILLVYDFFSLTPIESVADITNFGLFINPVYIVGGYGLGNLYRRVGHIPVTEGEMLTPPLRSVVPDNAYLLNQEVTGWNVFGADNTKLNTDLMAFDQVCHIDPYYLIIAIDYLPLRIGLEIFKKNKFFPDHISELNLIKKVMYRSVAEMPLLRDVPVEKRFKFEPESR